MALELTTTRRRVPFAETTFVKTVPPYIQTYLGAELPSSRRAGRDFDPFTLGRTEVDLVPRDRSTYLGKPEVQQVPSWRGTYIGDMGQHDYDARGRARELLGFGALDATIATTELQSMLRKAGSCEVGSIDGSFGPRTNGALTNFAMANPRRGGAGAYLAGTDFSASPGARSVRIDSGLLGKLRFAASGQIDECATPRRTGPMRPIPSDDGGGDGGGGGGESIFTNPLLWLGLAAAGAAYYYATREDDEMMLTDY